MPIELLHCPICGTPAFEPHNEKEAIGRPTWVIGCEIFCIQMRRNTKKQAIEDWNTRAETENEKIQKKVIDNLFGQGQCCMCWKRGNCPNKKLQEKHVCMEVFYEEAKLQIAEGENEDEKRRYGVPK